MAQLPRRVEKHIDLFHIRDPNFSTTGPEAVVPAPPPRGAMLFAHTPTVHPALLSPATVYRIVLVIAAENSPAREFTITVAFPVTLFDVNYIHEAAARITVNGLPTAMPTN
jgi:hypothetical protein